MNIAESVEAGRIHHQWLPDETRIERGALSVDTLQLYKSFGHKVSERSSQGAAMSVYHDRRANLFLGAADSRRGDGAAVGF
jgi:gamma-glutamyltranspeptidase/glutathione hydrolase